MKRMPKRTRTPPPGKLIYAASESCADMLYATGLMTPDPFIWYSTPAGSGMVVAPLELGRAQKQAKLGTTVLSTAAARKLWSVPTDKNTAADLLAALAIHSGVRSWAVPTDFPLGLARKLQRRGMALKPTNPFFAQRSRKDATEVERIREGVRLAEAGLTRALGILRDSSVNADGCLVWDGETLTAERLRGEVDAEIARRGGTASHTITAPGTQGADPHQAGHGIIQAGAPIVLDIFPRVDRTGYFGDLTRTVVKGQAPEIVRQAYNIVQQAQRRAIDTVRAGIPAGSVHQAALDVLDTSGFKTHRQANPPYGFFHSTGHGLGLEIHEGPRLSEGMELPLEAGNVVTVEPGLYYQDWGGVRLEDVVVVTDDGCENLTQAEFILELP